MPRPAGSETSYVPGLDGIRAIAVAAVVGYHLGAPWLPGGLLGVGVFFTLSGYLITTILITAWDRIGDLDLRHFWLRRARRLLPALIMVLIVVLVATPVLDNEVLPERGIEALAALFYVSNWITIASDVSYFQRFSGPGPLDHLWSLAVEEQFYLLWPLLLLLLFKTLARQARPDGAGDPWAGRRVVPVDVAAGGSRLRQLACLSGNGRACRRSADRRRPGHGVATYTAGQQDFGESAADRRSPRAGPPWRSSSACSS